MADLKHYCEDGRPVVVLVHWPDWQSSHYVAARGVSRGWVYYHCPIDGPGKCREAEFEAAWRADGRAADFESWGIVAWVP